jgi:hypothetical protein
MLKAFPRACPGVVRRGAQRALSRTSAAIQTLRQVQKVRGGQPCPDTQSERNPALVHLSGTYPITTDATNQPQRLGGFFNQTDRALGRASHNTRGRVALSRPLPPVRCGSMALYGPFELKWGV